MPGAREHLALCMASVEQASHDENCRELGYCFSPFAPRRAGVCPQACSGRHLSAEGILSPGQPGLGEYGVVTCKASVSKTPGCHESFPARKAGGKSKTPLQRKESVFCAFGSPHLDQFIFLCAHFNGSPLHRPCTCAVKQQPVKFKAAKASAVYTPGLVHHLGSVLSQARRGRATSFREADIDIAGLERVCPTDLATCLN